MRYFVSFRALTFVLSLLKIICNSKQNRKKNSADHETALYRYPTFSSERRLVESLPLF